MLLPPYRAFSETDKTLVVMTIANTQSERDLLIIPFRYSKFIFKKIKCLYTDQMNIKKQIIRRVVFITVSNKYLKYISELA